MSAFTLLDGGMGRELQERSLVINGTIWSARALIERPDVVTEVHSTFIDAGAEVIITSNYSAVPFLLALEKVEDQFEKLVSLAGVCAVEAKNRSTKPVEIAGSLPPLHHSYRPDEVGPEDENLALYSRIVGQLDPHVERYVCETMSTGLEARAAARAGLATGKPVWVAWTLDNANPGHLRSGESIQDAIDVLDGLDIDAYLFNCCSPESISHALPILRELTDKPIGGYANAFGARVPGSTRHTTRDDLSPSHYGEFVTDWLNTGATIIGGCCGIGPRHIEWLKQNKHGAIEC